MGQTNCSLSFQHHLKGPEATASGPFFDLVGLSDKRDCRGDLWSAAVGSFPDLAGERSSPLQAFLEICHLRRLQLKLQFVSNQGNKFGIRGFSLGVADGIAEKSLQGIQIATIPRNLNSVADGPFHPARCRLKCLCHLGVEHLGDGVRVPDGPRRGFWTRPFVRCFIAFSVAHFTIGSLGLS